MEVVEEKDFLSAPTKIQKINIIEESPISKSAEEEMASGRFLLETQIRPGVSKLEIYRNLIIRGGIFISLDTNKTKSKAAQFDDLFSDDSSEGDGLPF